MFKSENAYWKGRFKDIVSDDRICKLCDSAELCDEYHYTFECHFLKAERKHNSMEFYKKNTTQKYHNLYNVLEHTIILRIAKFCNIILALFK